MFLQSALPNDLIDFTSNDYLGFSSEIIFNDTREYLIKNKSLKKKRFPILSGNHQLYRETEAFIANFHRRDGLSFQSGLDANIVFSAVPQKEI
jgi:8-amino-7-oxononanoate synthase